MSILYQLKSVICMCVFIRVQLFTIPWNVAFQPPLSMGFSMQKYWSGLPFPTPKSVILVYKMTNVSMLHYQFSHPVVSDSLWPHGLQHARPPCSSPPPRVYSNSCPLSRWCHSTISSSVMPFSSCLQSFPESVSFPVSQNFTSGSQSIGASASASA